MRTAGVCTTRASASASASTSAIAIAIPAATSTPKTSESPEPCTPPRVHPPPLGADHSPTYTRRTKDAWSARDIADLPTHLRPERGETLELILRKRIYLLQSRRGYRANTDSQILAYFASRRHSRSDDSQGGEHLVLDLGAGNGLVSILYARASVGTARLRLLEVQPALAYRARRNLELNDLEGEVHEHDIASGIPNVIAGDGGSGGGVDVVLMNPPFYAPGTRAPPRREEKRIAHIETTADIGVFCRAAAEALSGVSSRLYAVYNVKELGRLRSAIDTAGMRVMATQCVRHAPCEAHGRVLVEAALKTDESDPDADADAEIELAEMCLHPEGASIYEYFNDMEKWLDGLPTPKLRIGQLRI